MSDGTGHGIGEGPAKVVSVSLPEGTVAALREMAGARGVSSFVATAVEQHIRDRRTDDYLEEYQREHGAFTAEELRAAEEVWDAAERKAERAAGTWSETE